MRLTGGGKDARCKVLEQDRRLDHTSSLNYVLSRGHYYGIEGKEPTGHTDTNLCSLCHYQTCSSKGGKHIIPGELFQERLQKGGS